MSTAMVTDDVEAFTEKGTGGGFASADYDIREEFKALFEVDNEQDNSDD